MAEESWVNEVLDFGDEPVKDLETKLAILKFDYNWADMVEKEEKRRGKPDIPERWPDHIPDWMRLTEMMPSLKRRPKLTSSMKGNIKNMSSSSEIVWMKREPPPTRIRILTRARK